MAVKLGAGGGGEGEVARNFGQLERGGGAKLNFPNLHVLVSRKKRL